MAEIVHASARGESITVIFVNNAICDWRANGTHYFVRTSDHYHPTEDRRRNRYPLKMAELLAQNQGSAYICRTAVNNPANVIRTKKSIKKALQMQMQKKGFTMVEILSTCPTNWGLSPLEALTWLEENMIPYYPLGEFVVKEDG